jgi:superfamily II DNA or RNA helicase
VQKLQGPWSGQRVYVRGEPWVVVQADRFSAATLLGLRGIGPSNLGETSHVVLPFDRPRVHVAHALPKARSRSRVLRIAAATLAASPAWTDCGTAVGAAIDLRAWQLEPALAAVAGATRMLLADGVGLGKTIQALLVVSELHARGLAERALVLTPASLRDQWADEMRSRFGLDARVLDQGSIAVMTRELPPGINPWQTSPFVVASIDLVKRDEVRTALDASALDILIVDEAHHLTPGSDRAAVVADLARRAPWVVLVTATPHSGDDAAYRFLLSLGAVDDADEIRIFRRTSTALKPCARRTHLTAVQPDEAERALLAATLDYARALWRSGPDRSATRLLATVIARRAASCPSAAGRTLARRLALVRDGGQATSELQPPLPWDDELDDALQDGCLGAPGLVNPADEVAQLAALVGLAARAPQPSSKTRFIRRLLRRTAESCIVFSEYRDVVETVVSSIADLASVAVLHGGLSSVQRRDALAAFVTGGARVLVATDAAGEGLNLHARCRLIVTLELPWNPHRLEQRVGRVDRLGQTRRVHAFHLFHRGSIEETVLAHLERRRLRARADLEEHEATFSEAAVTLTALEGRPLPYHSARPSARIAPCDGKHAERADALRHLQAQATTGGLDVGRRATFARSGRVGRHRAVALLFAADAVDKRDRLQERATVCLRVMPTTVGRLHRMSPQDMRALADNAAVQAVLDAELRHHLVDLREAVDRCAAGVERRVAAIVAALASRHAVVPIQISLFDRRAIEQALAVDETRRAWIAHLEQQRTAAAALRTLTILDVRLVAAWPCD